MDFFARSFFYSFCDGVKPAGFSHRGNAMTDYGDFI